MKTNPQPKKPSASQNDIMPSSGACKSRQLSTYKHHSVYDVVAGRISTSGFFSRPVPVNHKSHSSSASHTVSGPEQVLFRSRMAPTRYADYDIYFANERSPVSDDLPPSDLLKALHSFTSDYYFNATPDKGIEDWKTLDGTALIALGILAEELIQEVLGQTGDLALTEGEETTFQSQEKSISPPPRQRNRPYRKKRRVDHYEQKETL